MLESTHDWTLFVLPRWAIRLLLFQSLLVTYLETSVSPTWDFSKLLASLKFGGLHISDWVKSKFDKAGGYKMGFYFP